MAINTTGRLVLVKKKSELKRVKVDPSLFSFNHFKVLFSDNSERHFLFTDKEIQSALEKSKSLEEELVVSWIKEFWFEDFIDVSSEDLKDSIRENSLPKIAKKYNHIRISFDNEQYNLLFSDAVIKKALARAEGQKLPKISWVIDGVLEGVKCQQKELKQNLINLS